MQSWISYILIVSVLLILPLISAPYAIRSVGRTVGWYLCRRTSARRELIFARVKAEEDEYKSKVRKSAKPEDDDWEQVESQGAGATTTGNQGNKDWEGVVGFFHPFWYRDDSWMLYKMDCLTPILQ